MLRSVRCVHQTVVLDPDGYQTGEISACLSMNKDRQQVMGAVYVAVAFAPKWTLIHTHTKTIGLINLDFVLPNVMLVKIADNVVTTFVFIVISVNHNSK